MHVTYPRRMSGNSDRFRAPKLKHAVQGSHGNGNLGRTTPVRPRAQRIRDDSFEAADGGLHQGSLIIPGPLLPARTTAFGDASQMLIPLGRSGAGDLVQNSSWSRLHDYLGSLPVPI